MTIQELSVSILRVPTDVNVGKGTRGVASFVQVRIVFFVENSLWFFTKSYILREYKNVLDELLLNEIFDFTVTCRHR